MKMHSFKMQKQNGLALFIHTQGRSKGLDETTEEYKPSEHLSDSCISTNLMGNPNKCRSQLALIQATLPVVTNSPLPPFPMSVCVYVSSLMFNANSLPFALIIVSAMNF